VNEVTRRSIKRKKKLGMKRKECDPGGLRKKLSVLPEGASGTASKPAVPFPASEQHLEKTGRI